MKTKILYLFVALTLSGLPQSASDENILNPQDSLYFTATNLSQLKYSINSSDLYSEQLITNLEPFVFAADDESVSNKSPWLAFGLSLLYPGLGQLYNAEYGKALLIGGLGTVGLGLAMLAAMSTDFDSESNPDYIGVMLYSGVAIYGCAYV